MLLIPIENCCLYFGNVMLGKKNGISNTRYIFFRSDILYSSKSSVREMEIRNFLIIKWF